MGVFRKSSPTFPGLHNKTRALWDLFSGPLLMEVLRWTPHPIIVAITDNKDYVRVLVYSYYTTITGWGVLLR